LQHFSSFQFFLPNLDFVCLLDTALCRLLLELSKVRCSIAKCIVPLQNVFCAISVDEKKNLQKCKVYETAVAQLVEKVKLITVLSL
jgi:hypothetical protein